MADDDPRIPEQPPGLSRRDFLKIGGMTAAVPLIERPRLLQVAGGQVEVHGPGKSPVVLTVNGKKYTEELEPRVTLLDALRDSFDLTGSKRVCDRAECGACTVLMDGNPVYACSVLAIDAQGAQITTIEGITQAGELTPVQQAFVDNDAQQCGFCTPGFVMATKAMLDRHPNPTPEQVQKQLAGNFCRCGTYFGIRGAVAQVGGKGESHA